MEYGSIEREIHVEASAEVVFEVISSPEHLSEWWPDEAHLEPSPGSVGELVFGDRAGGADPTVVPITVLEVEPPRRFAFRWVHAADQAASPGNSLLVTFDLVPSGSGTTVRMRETGFRELGWEAAVLEEQFREHEVGWDHFLPRLQRYAAKLAAAR